MPSKFSEDVEGACLRDVCENLSLLDDGLQLKFSLHLVGPVYMITGMASYGTKRSLTLETTLVK